MAGRDEKRREDETGTYVMISLGLCAIGWAIWAKLPQLAFLLVGGGIGAAASFWPRSDGPAWRAVGVKLVAAGVVVGCAFALLDGPIGADAQMRRFNRAWGEEATAAAALKHPWAVIPLGSAFMLTGLGSALIWRAK